MSEDALSKSIQAALKARSTEGSMMFTLLESSDGDGYKLKVYAYDDFAGSPPSGERASLVAIMRLVGLRSLPDGSVVDPVATEDGQETAASTRQAAERDATIRELASQQQRLMTMLGEQTSRIVSLSARLTEAQEVVDNADQILAHAAACKAEAELAKAQLLTVHTQLTDALTKVKEWFGAKAERVTTEAEIDRCVAARDHDGVNRAAKAHIASKIRLTGAEDALDALATG